MNRPRALVLRTPLRDPSALAAFVETSLRDGVALLAVVGPGCEAIEDEIDWLVVGDGSDEHRFLLTSSHADETLDDALEFAEGWAVDGVTCQVEIIDL